MHLGSNIEPVSELAKFLPYLDRGDVTELVFESGLAARAKQRGQLRPVTREPLSSKHILRLVHNTPLQSLLPPAEGGSTPVSTQIDGVEYVATLARSGSSLMLRVRRPGRDTVRSRDRSRDRSAEPLLSRVPPCLSSRLRTSSATRPRSMMIPGPRPPSPSRIVWKTRFRRSHRAPTGRRPTTRRS